MSIIQSALPRDNVLEGARFTEEAAGLHFRWRPLIESDGLRFFGRDRDSVESKRARPLRVCVVTSVRDVGCDDLANRSIKIGNESVYVRGSLHALLDATKHELRNVVEVVGIVVDDVAGSAEIRRNGQFYSHLPIQGEDCWIVPKGYTLNGIPLTEMVRSIPSAFRKLPRLNASDWIERAREKIRFERAIHDYAREQGADVILSDHLMVKLEHLYREGLYAGRLINIHPAITWQGDDNKLRGRSPTRDALERAREKNYLKTGASLHFISQELDAGLVICDGERTPVHLSDSPSELRLRNYKFSKIPVLISGLRYLASNFEQLVMQASMQDPYQEDETR